MTRDRTILREGKIDKAQAGGLHQSHVWLSFAVACGRGDAEQRDVNIHPATGPAFQVTTTCKTGLTLAPGATCTVGVHFAPTAPGQTSGGLWLHNTTVTPDQ